MALANFSSEYNSWDSKQLSKWLKNNKITFSSDETRDDLLGIVRKNWNSATASALNPFASWSDEHLVDYLSQKGVTVKASAANNRDWLVSQANKAWKSTGSDVEETYSNAKYWIFDQWSESALKKFLDTHHFGASAAATKDALLQRIRDNYDYIASAMKTESQSSSDWLFDAWSDSDLVEWLTSHGYNVPKKTTTREELIKLVHKYSYQASQNANNAKAGVQTTFNDLHKDVLDASGKVKDTVFDTWSESQLKSWLEAKGIAISSATPSKNELLKLARHHRSLLKQDLDSTTSGVKDSYNKIIDSASNTKDTVTSRSAEIFKAATDSWSDSRLKEFLQARGIIAPENTPTERLKQLVFQNRQKPVASYDYWSFESWSLKDLQNWFSDQSETATGTRDQLAARAGKSLTALKDQGGDAYTSALAKIQNWYSSGKDGAFDTWSDSDLKAYLDSYGIKAYQGSTRNELLAQVRHNTNLFRHGADPEGWSTSLQNWKNALIGAASGAASQTKKFSERVADGIKGLGRADV